MSDFEAVPSEFRCSECDAHTLSVRIRYDNLGYAVCPGCGRSTRPNADVPSAEWAWGAEVNAVRSR